MDDARQQNNLSIFWSITALTASSIAALFLTVEFFFQLQGGSLCKTTSCTIVGNYIKIQETLLIACGASFFWLLTGLFYFSRTYPRIFIPLSFLVLATALSFDASIIGFQYFSIHAWCLICYITASFLITCALLWSISCKKIYFFLIFIFCWIGAFSSQTILKMPAPKAAFQQMIFFESEASSAEDHSVPKTITFIFSMKCPHCLELIKHISQMNYQKYDWKFACIDEDNESLTKVSTFLENVQDNSNPFEQLSYVKEMVPEKPISLKKRDVLQKKASQALSYLANIGIQTIPVIVIRETSASQKILVGTELAKKELQKNV